jgi:tRNA nucleotidyltransferase/poly(A) polymerase
MTMTEMTAAEFVLDTLRKNGFEAFFAGGCVRDLVLGRKPKDFDINTDATPEQVRPLFEHTIPVGAAFGVVVVMVEGHQFEVATYRADGAYSDGRRPDEVTYSKSAKEDVQRRDFTMNGLLMTNQSRTLPLPEDALLTFLDNDVVVLDFVGGEADIKAKVIRCIGDPNRRFAEDALRMMRAVRFVGQLGFEIEAETFKAIQANVDSIVNVSRERVVVELFKLTTGKFAARGVAALVATGLFRRIFPSKFVEDANVALMLERFSLNQTTDPVVGLAMMMADTSLSGAEEALDSLKLSKDVYNMVYGALANQLNLCHASNFDDAEVVLMAREAGVLNPGVALFEQTLGMAGLGCGVEAGMSTVLRFRSFTNEQINPAPLVTGADLITMGFKPGPMFTRVLRAVEFSQLNGDFATRKEALDFAKSEAEKEG